MVAPVGQMEVGKMTACYYGGGSQLGFVGGIAESPVEVVCFLLFSATTLL